MKEGEGHEAVMGPVRTDEAGLCATPRASSSWSAENRDNGLVGGRKG